MNYNKLRPSTLMVAVMMVMYISAKPLEKIVLFLKFSHFFVTNSIIILY